MITDAILDVIFGVVDWVIGLFPVNTLDLSGLAEGQQYLGWVGILFDMTAIAAAVSVMVTVELALVTVRLSLFVWRLVKP